MAAGGGALPAGEFAADGFGDELGHALPVGFGLGDAFVPEGSDAAGGAGWVVVGAAGGGSAAGSAGGGGVLGHGFNVAQENVVEGLWWTPRWHIVVLQGNTGDGDRETKMECHLKTKNTSTECSTADPEMFKVQKIWAGRKSTVTECLAHAASSEQRGQRVDIIHR